MEIKLQPGWMRVNLHNPTLGTSQGSLRRYTVINVPEVAVCEELQVDLVWGLGGPCVETSSELLDRSL